jgi:hypothetical protein
MLTAMNETRNPTSTAKKTLRILFGSFVAVVALVAVLSDGDDPGDVAPAGNPSTTSENDGEFGPGPEPQVIYSEDGDSITPLPGGGFSYSDTNGNNVSTGW